MTGEESGRVMPRELRNTGVPAHVGLQRLLCGGEGVEQVQCQLPVVSFVVPLQQDVQRNRDLTGLVEHGTGHEAPGEEAGSREARFDPDFWIVEIETDSPETFIEIVEE